MREYEKRFARLEKRLKTEKSERADNLK